LTPYAGHDVRAKEFRRVLSAPDGSIDHDVVLDATFR